jgi:hypothetical protein
LDDTVLGNIRLWKKQFWMEKKPLKPFKVVHLITLLEMGGAQGNTLHTVRTLDSTRFAAELWAGPGAYWDGAAETDLGKEGRLRFFKHLVRPVNPIFDLIAFFDLRKALNETKPAILHTHSSKAGIIGRFAAQNIPVVIHTFHGFGFNDRQNPIVFWFYVWLERWAAKRTHALVFVSRSNMETAQAFAQILHTLSSSVVFGFSEQSTCRSLLD